MLTSENTKYILEFSSRRILILLSTNDKAIAKLTNIKSTSEMVNFMYQNTYLKFHDIYKCEVI